MNQLNASQFKSISDLPRKYSQILEDANEFGYVYLLKNNRPVGGIFGIDYLEKMRETMRKEILLEIEREDAYKRIQRGLEEYRQGKAKVLKSFKDLV